MTEYTSCIRPNSSRIMSYMSQIIAYLKKPKSEFIKMAKDKKYKKVGFSEKLFVRLNKVNCWLVLKLILGFN